MFKYVESVIMFFNPLKFFFNKSRNHVVFSLKSLINLDKYVHKPRKLRSSLTVVGGLAFLIASCLFGSGFIPFLFQNQKNLFSLEQKYTF